MDEEKVEAKLGDKAFSISGPTAPLIAVMVIFGGLIVWTNTRFISWMNDFVKEQKDEHAAIKEAVETMSWINSLPPDRRPELVMPDHVIKRLKGMQPYYGDIESERARNARERQKK